LLALVLLSIEFRGEFIVKLQTTAHQTHAQCMASTPEKRSTRIRQPSMLVGRNTSHR
jgi:hypothetical protein